jgi:hypothetical protein
MTKEMLNDEKRFNCKAINITLCKMVLTHSNDNIQEMIELARHV